MKSVYNLKAELYEKFRWDYPIEAVNWIIETAKISTKSVLCDVGAGTGKLTQLLVGKAKKLFAIDPDSGMLNILRRKGLQNVIPIETESNKLQEVGNSSIDVILAAHALHWFAYPSTLVEFNRIMKSDGYLVNINNSYTDKSEIDEEIRHHIKKYERPVHYVKHAMDTIESYYDVSTYCEKYFSFTIYNDFQSYLGGLCSASFYPDESNGAEYEQMKSDIYDIFSTRCRTGQIELHCKCCAGIGRLKHS